MEELSDSEVLDRAIEGDPDAFGILYERNVNRIYNYIFYRTGNQNDAEDITARVFYRAVGHIKYYRNTGVPFSAWLFRIAHNLVANWHRDQKQLNEVPLEDYMPHQHQEHPETEIIHNIENENLLAIIRKLPEERQELLILKFVEHLSNAEIAVILRRSEGAIKSLYHRTLTALREETQKLYEDG